MSDHPELENNPLWQHHQRMIKPLICPELLEPNFDEARSLILDLLEGRGKDSPSDLKTIEFKAIDTDAKNLYHTPNSDNKSE
jgi:hypothetical protein